MKFHHRLLATHQVSIGYKAAFVPHLQSVGLLAFFEPERLYGQVTARGGVQLELELGLGLGQGLVLGLGSTLALTRRLHPTPRPTPN